MELIYIDYLSSEIQIENEIYYFIFNYIIGRKIYLHSNLAYILYLLKNMKKFKDEDFLLYIENYILQNVSFSDNDIVAMLDALDVTREKLKTNKILKSRKHLSKNNLEFVKAMQKATADDKILLNKACDNSIDIFNLNNFIELVDDEIFELSFSFSNRDRVINNIAVTEEILNVLLRKEKMMIIGSILSEISCLLLPEDMNELSSSTNENIEIIKLPLITVPSSIEMTKDNLIVLRNYFLKRFDDLFIKIQNFRLDLNKLNFNSDIKFKVIEFKESIKDDLNAIQNDIDKHIYFSKIKNGALDYVNVTLTLAIIPNEKIGLIYSSSGVISLDKVLYLKRKIIEEIGENRCEIFTYYDIEQIYTN